MKKIIYTILLVLIVASLIGNILPVQAQGLMNINGNLEKTSQAAGVSGQTDIVAFAALVVQALLGLLGAIFVILIIYGGITWMTAMGAEDKVSKAKKIIINAVIGLIIVMISYSIAYLVAVILETKTY